MIALILLVIALGGISVYQWWDRRQENKNFRSVEARVAEKTKELEEKTNEYNALVESFQLLSKSMQQSQLSLKEATEALVRLGKAMSNKQEEKTKLEVEVAQLDTTKKTVLEEMQDNNAKLKQAEIDRIKLEIKAEEDRLRKDYGVFREETEKKVELLRADLKVHEDKMIAIVEEQKRKEEMEMKKDFYRLNLSEDDLQDVSILREATRKLCNPSVIGKVIWTAYYQQPYKDMCGRTNAPDSPGIYKITSLTDEKIYVGQSTSIKKRWSEHIKRGVGADTATKIKLYDHMKKYGVENFTFEIIEECEKSDLNDREKYYINYFKSNEFGLNMKSGG